MISASESDEFVPYGRQYCSVHPGRSPLQIKGRAVTDHGLPIVKALKDISITQSVKVRIQGQSLRRVWFIARLVWNPGHSFIFSGKYLYLVFDTRLPPGWFKDVCTVLNPLMRNFSGESKTLKGVIVGVKFSSDLEGQKIVLRCFFL